MAVNKPSGWAAWNAKRGGADSNGAGSVGSRLNAVLAKLIQFEDVDIEALSPAKRKLFQQLNATRIELQKAQLNNQTADYQRQKLNWDRQQADKRKTQRAKNQQYAYDPVANVGRRVRYSSADFFSPLVRGKLVSRGGRVMVRLDEKEMTSSGYRRYVSWNQAWRLE